MNPSSSNNLHTSRSAWLAWALCGMIGVLVMINLGLYLSDRPASDSIIKLAVEIVWRIIPVIFAGVGALIISRQPRNTIGWLLMTPAIAFVVIPPVDNYIGSFTTTPPPTLSVWLAVWFQSWAWLLFIIPLLLTLLLFPTGKPLSPRWRWVTVWALGTVTYFAVMGMFLVEFQPENVTWTLPNPIGFITDTLEPYIAIPLIFGLGLPLTCAASLFVRYRRAPAVEREQIKWLLYAGAIFTALYVPEIALMGGPEGLAGEVGMLLTFLSMPLIPVAIGIAILRYRLWDIDILIRKTLIYTVLTTILALIYFSSVILLQQAVGAITGIKNLPAITILSTLAIAALFTPLRRRVQDFIDRRFYRKKYDAQKIL